MVFVKHPGEDDEWDDNGEFPAPDTPPPVAPPPAVVPAAATAGTTGVGGGGGAGEAGLGVGKPLFDFGPVPEFVPPNFVAPTLEDAMKEPGYQFRLQEGSNAIEHSAAAAGLLRTGGTFKDLNKWGQNFASQEYGNVFNRALSTYDRKYQGMHDAYAPRLAQWSMLSNAELQAELARYQREYQMYALAHQGGGGGGYPEQYTGTPNPY